MSVNPDFGSVEEADAAYYGEGGGPDDGPSDEDDGSGATWGELQQGASLGSGWTLAYQDQQNGDRRRWFAIRMADSSLQAIQPSGTVYDAQDSDSLSELPHYESEGSARDAFEAWADENGGPSPDGEDGSQEWGKWQKLTEQDPWHLYTRSHQTEDRQQYLAAGTLGDGSSVYLAPEGQVADEPHVYDSASALSSALQAYFQAAKNGNIPEGRTPTGDAPSTETVRKEATRQSSSSKSSRLVEKLGGTKVALAAVAIGGLAVYQSQKNGGS